MRRAVSRLQYQLPHTHTSVYRRLFARTMSSSHSKGSPYGAKITAIEELDKGNWIQTRKIKYQDPHGNDRLWEMAIRTTRSETTNVDAVSIIAILEKEGRDREVVLIKQFRPPTGKVVLELPAGLIDPKESIASTAVRELIEETGYYGTFARESVAVFSDPGLTNANMVLAYVDVDLSDPRNKNPKAELEDGEFIEMFHLPLKGLLGKLEELVEKEGCTVDARLYHFAVGLDIAQSL